MIYFEHVTYTYPEASRSALRGVTLHLSEGEFGIGSWAVGRGQIDAVALHQWFGAPF